MERATFLPRHLWLALLAQPVPLGAEIGIKLEVQALLTEILSTKRC